MKRFTFKRDAPITGLAGVGYPHRGSEIKLNKKIVGEILAPNYTTKDDYFRIRFYISAPDEKCGFKSIILKQLSESDADARLFINKHAEAIIAKYEFSPRYEG